MSLIAGVEGGGTQSKLMLMTREGRVLAQAEGGCTNHYLATLNGAVAEIVKMVQSALSKADRVGETLLVLGLALSGIENEEIKANMEAALRAHAPALADKYYICGDVFGSVATASKDGGICLIAGTGSNCLAVNPDGTIKTCGGWGHVLGDYASGYDTAIRAIRTIFAVTEGMVSPDENPPDVTYLRDQMMDYFKISTFKEMLGHAYTHFDKSHFAAFTLRVARGADNGDAFSRALMFETGCQMARHIRAVLPSVSPQLLQKPGGLPIICVGSVFLSFKQLQEGFLSIVKTMPLPNGIRLMRLTKPAALGAAALAAKNCLGEEIALDYGQNADEFFHFHAAPR